MKQFGNGPWKEGRAGAASLCYLGLSPEQIEVAAKHHAAVGIRATIACAGADAALAELARCNWDLAVAAHADTAATAERLCMLDGRRLRGCIRAGESSAAGDPDTLYHVTDTPGTLDAAGPLPAMLPSMATMADADELAEAIDAVVSKGKWAIWRMDADVFEAMSTQGHHRLLHWLGHHHAHIWCAPIRDIFEWIHAGGHEAGRTAATR